MSAKDKELESLTPLGAASTSTKLDCLVVLVSTPLDEDEGDLACQLTDLEKQIALLKQEVEYMFSTEFPLYDYLIRLNARSTDIISQKTVDKPFWTCVKGKFEPKAGNAFSSIYEIKDSLELHLFTYKKESTKDKLRLLKEKLGNLNFDLKMNLDGTYQEDLATFMTDPTWIIPRDVPAEKPTPSPKKTWGDHSSEDEDEYLIDAISSLTNKKETKIPGIKLPGDFEQSFPMLWTRLDRLTTAFGWTIESDKTVNLRSQGLVPFQESDTGKIEHTLENNERLALLSLYALVGSLFLKPQTLAEKDNTEVALTYVCSVIAREKLATEENKSYLTVSFKNGDGGRSVLQNRLQFLCKTGDSAVEMVFQAVEKLISKFARELKEDQLDKQTVEAIKERAFTSIDGMIANCFRKSKIPIYEDRVVPGKKGKQPTKVGEKTTVSPPDLTTSRAALKPSEMTKVKDLRDSFNNRKAEAEKRISKVTNSTLFTDAKICKNITDEAYGKLQGYKTILRQRGLKIREEATALNKGAKPGPGHWATAEAKVLKDSDEIPDEIFDHLKWD